MDAVPLFHQVQGLSPMVEVALTQVRLVEFCDSGSFQISKRVAICNSDSLNLYYPDAGRVGGAAGRAAHRRVLPRQRATQGLQRGRVQSEDCRQGMWPMLSGL